MTHFQRILQVLKHVLVVHTDTGTTQTQICVVQNSGSQLDVLFDEYKPGNTCTWSDRCYSSRRSPSDAT